MNENTEPTNNTTATGSRGPSEANEMDLNINPLKYISCLPEFNGKGNELFTFLDLVDQISPEILKYNISSQAMLLNKIKSKLSGKAREVIEINCHLKTWSEIKKILIDNFGDKKSSLQIFDELRSVIFTSNSVDFYNQVTSILRRLNNKVKDEPNSEIITKSNIQTALRIFKDKLPEPMRSILFSRNPKTLEEALDILVEGNYAYHNPFKINFQKNKNVRSQEPNNTKNHFFNNHPPQPHFNKTQNFKQNQQFNFNRPPNFRQNQQSYFNKSQNFKQNQQPFDSNRSQSFRQNQSPQSKRNDNYRRPEPMEIDQTINSRIHSLETQEFENFPLVASESKNYLI